MQESDGKDVMVQGRIVWTAGDLFAGRVKTIFGTQTPQLDPQGQKQIQYGFGLAVPKAELADPVRGAIWMAMHEEAWKMFPSRVIPPSFAMKFKDGDGLDDQGKSFALREGHAGCIVFALTTNWVIRFFKWEGGANVQINSGIKNGDYVEVQVNVKAHAAMGQGKAGLYVNPRVVRLVAAGKEIINAPSGDQVFGQNAPAAPTNYVAPEMGALPQAPAMPGQPQYPQQPAYPQQPQAQPAAPAPHWGVMPQAFQPQGQPMGNPMQPVGAAMPVMPGYPQQMVQPGPYAQQPAYPSNPGGMPAIPR